MLVVNGTTTPGAAARVGHSRSRTGGYNVLRAVDASPQVKANTKASAVYYVTRDFEREAKAIAAGARPAAHRRSPPCPRRRPPPRCNGANVVIVVGPELANVGRHRRHHDHHAPGRRPPPRPRIHQRRPALARQSSRRCRERTSTREGARNGRARPCPRAAAASAEAARVTASTSSTAPSARAWVAVDGRRLAAVEARSCPASSSVVPCTASAEPVLSIVATFSPSTTPSAVSRPVPRSRVRRLAGQRDGLVDDPAVARRQRRRRAARRPRRGRSR